MPKEPDYDVEEYNDFSEDEQDFLDNIDDKKKSNGNSPADYDDDYGYGDYYGGASPMDKHSDLLKELTNFDPFLRTQVAEWLGMVWNPKKGKFIDDPNVAPMMNIKGARWSINFLRTYTRSNNVITHLDEDTYRYMMDDVIEVAILGIGTRCEDFGIESEADMQTIYTEIIHAIQLILSGTFGTNSYTNFFRDSAKFNQNVNNAPMPMQSGQKKGVLSRFMEKVF